MATKNSSVKLEKLLSLSNKNDSQEAKWLKQELAACKFEDERLEKRFRSLLEQLWNGKGESIPFACQDWANTKAAYRFLSNDRVDEQRILQGHFQSTKKRSAAQAGPILVLHDTTEFSYKSEHPDWIGATHQLPLQVKAKIGKTKGYTMCGILMHSSLALTLTGLPLGLAATKIWTRKQFKGSNALKKHMNPTRMPIEQKESYRWLENLKQSTKLINKPEQCIHIGDRESDIYELFCTAKKLGTHFLIRTCVDRLAGNGEHTIADEMEDVRVKGVHRVEVQDKHGNMDEAILEIKYRHIQVLPPIGKQKHYPALRLTVIQAEECTKPKNRERIVWKLITDLSVTSRKEAIEKLNWYAMRWKIETFHKIIKSGCKAEESKLRTAERLAKLIAVFCIMSWRIFWITMLNRCCKNASVQLALTKFEINLLDKLIKDKIHLPAKNLAYYITKIAKLGGYLARSSDPPPGNKVMWRGLARLSDIEIGFNLALKIVGN